MNLKANDIVVIAEGWEGLWLAKQLSQRQKLTVLYRPQMPLGLPVHLGNGELYEVALRTMGKDIAGPLWELSKDNLNRAKAQIGKWVQTYEKEQLYFLSEPNQKEYAQQSAEKESLYSVSEEKIYTHLGEREFLGVLKGPSLCLDFEAFQDALAKDLRAGGFLQSVAQIQSVESKGFGQHEINFERGKEAKKITATVVIVVGDTLLCALFPKLNEKIIPITLSTFCYESAPSIHNLGMAIFHSGADFAFVEEDGLRLGSFRNLYSDKGVGIQDTIDPTTQSGIQGYFSKMDWISAEPTESYINYESVSCDGLPVVSALSESPGIFVAGGFAGRAANYWFSVSDTLVKGLLDKASFDPIQQFSLKRML